MESTVIGVFDNYSQAQNALNELTSRGFSRSDVQLSPSEDSPAARQSMLQSDEGAHEQSTGGSGIGHFFRSLFGGEENSEHADVYSEAVRRGSYLLTVNAHNDEQRDEIVNVLDQFDPVDVDERSSQWRAQGWSQYDRSAAPLNEEEIQRERSSYTTPQAQTTQQNLSATQDQQMRTSNLQGETKIPVVEEELQVGKREVQRGGVRVFQRVTEKPVQESVQLREEHVKVERHAVDQPATEADMAAFKEGSIELRETAEEPIVQKTARVVEEVVLGKEVSQRQETVSDTVRRTDVEVEQLGAQSGAGRSGMTMDDSDFRNHWQTTYGHLGGTYDDYKPAYEYGTKLRSDERYGSYRWGDLEPEARTNWESSNSGSPWEKAKDAVRYGWERITK